MEQIRDAEAVAAGKGDIWRVSVKPSDGPKLANLLGHDVRLQFDWGGGLVWACVPRALMSGGVMNEIDGHATLVAQVKRQRNNSCVPPGTGTACENQCRASGRFDPHGVLNPGRMG